MGDYVTVSTADGDYQAYVARPAAAPAAAIVVLPEIFGINADLRATCAELSVEGFIALSPDLFWRQEPGLDLNSWSEEEWKKGLELYQAYDFDKGVEDVASAMSAARTLPGASGKVGVMGFCLGGLMTYLVTARKGADAAVAYYGGETDQHLDEAPSITDPLMMHLGEEDEFISQDAQRRIRDALKGNPHVEIYSYPGCSHAFARHTGAHFDAAAAAKANHRTRDFFRKHLG